MKKLLLSLLCSGGAGFPALAAAGGPPPAAVGIGDIRWEARLPSPGGKPAYQGVKGLALRGGRIAPGRVRVSMSLVNSSTHNVEGVLLRYAFSALVGKSGAGGDQSWDVPFRLDERKIPRLAAGESARVRVDPALLSFYLGRLSRAGFSAREIRLEASIEPKLGDPGLVKAESSLPIEKK